MPSRDPRRRFVDIVDFAAAVFHDIDGLSFEDFSLNGTVQRSVIYSLQCISEAAVKLGDEAVSRAPEIEWRGVRGFGNVSRHEYGRVDLELVWQICTEDLPVLADRCRRIAEDPDWR